MPAKDMFHDAVKTALIKDSWAITDDPLRLRFGGVRMYIDLGASKIIAAQKGTQQIAVEIKSFVKKPFLTEFHEAVGQFMNYRLVLHEKDPERTLYLAIPKDIYKTHFILPFTQLAITTYQLKYLVYDVHQEEIIKWQP